MRRIAPILLAAALALSMLAFAPAVSETDDPSGDQEPTTTEETAEDEDETTHFLWEGPADLTGTFAATLRFEWDGDNDCIFFHGFAGDLGGTTPLHFWSKWRTGGEPRGWAGLWHYELVHAHVGEAVDTRGGVISLKGAWTGYKTLEGTFSEFLEVTTAGFDLEVWTHRTQPPPAPPDAPVWIELTCERPFRVGPLAAGLEGQSFVQGSLEGGAGASAGVEVVARDGLAHTFANSAVLLDIHRYGSSPLAAGQLSLDHPAGTESWLLLDADPDPEHPSFNHDITFSGGPGDYTLTLDRASPGSDIPGILVGLDPVNCLDEAVSLDPATC